MIPIMYNVSQNSGSNRSFTGIQFLPSLGTQPIVQCFFILLHFSSMFKVFFISSFALVCRHKGTKQIGKRRTLFAISHQSVIIPINYNLIGPFGMLT